MDHQEAPPRRALGVDLDDCPDSDAGSVAPWAETIIEMLDSFTEVSPSGTGFHVLCRGELPDGRNRNGDLELYDTAGFFTVTADHVADTPTQITDAHTALEAVHDDQIAADTEAATTTAPAAPNAHDGDGDVPDASLDDEVLLRRARTAENGAKFERLWRGSTSGYPSHSEADMALCSMLGFWTGGNARQMDRLFRESGLMREKWDEVHYADGATYGEKTIERAIATTSEYYDPNYRLPSNTDGRASHRENGSGEIPKAKLLEQVAALERELRTALDETVALEADLADAEQRIADLEAELEAERSDDWWPFTWP